MVLVILWWDLNAQFLLQEHGGEFGYQFFLCVAWSAERTGHITLKTVFMPGAVGNLMSCSAVESFQALEHFSLREMNGI